MPPLSMTLSSLLLWLLTASALAHIGAGQVLGDVFMYEDGRGEREPVHFDPFPDLPADFGPEVPDEGVDGLLLVADPEDACQPFKFRYDDEPWVALISRSQHLHPTNCTFDVKVRNAEAAGAAAAIVYDDVYEALIIMSKPRDHPDPGIPAVFVSEKAGIIMRKLMTPGITRVRIVPVSASAWMSLLMSAFLGFLALTVVLATFYIMRSWSMWLGRTRRQGMTPELAGFGAGAAQASVQEGLPAFAIRALPILIYEGKAGKRRRSSLSKGSAGDAAQQAEPSAPVPIAAGAAAAAAAAAAREANSSVGAAWMLGTASAPALQQGVAGETGAQPLPQLRLLTADRQGQATAASGAAVVLIESDGEDDTSALHLRDASSAQEQQQQQQQQSPAEEPAGSFSQRLASSSSAFTSGLVSLASLASLAAAGSRRVLLMAPHSPASIDASSSPSPGGGPAAAAAAGTVCGPAPAHSAAVDVPCGAAAGPGPTAAAEAGGSGCGSPTGSGSCRSSMYSTDEEDPDVPEVAQSWPGAGSLARVVTGGPVGMRGGATRHTCVVCLERYHAGDKVRVLPCQHRFHAKCIDPWLASRRLCPVCKHDASTWPRDSMQAALAGSAPLQAPAGPAAAAAAAAGPLEAGGGVRLLSGPLSGAVVSLGRGYWFRRLRARLARASRRRQQHEQQQLLLGGVVVGAAGGAAAAAAEAAEAGLLPLQAPPAAALEAHAVLQASSSQAARLQGLDALQQQQQQQQARTLPAGPAAVSDQGPQQQPRAQRQLPQVSRELQEPLLQDAGAAGYSGSQAAMPGVALRGDGVGT